MCRVPACRNQPETHQPVFEIGAAKMYTTYRIGKLLKQLPVIHRTVSRQGGLLALVFSLTAGCQIADMFERPSVRSKYDSGNKAEFNLLQAYCDGNRKVFKLKRSQHRSLYSVCHAWYPGSDLPMVTESKIRGACQRLTHAGDEEAEFLRTALGLNLARSSQDIMCYMATLNRDNDKFLDYQISDAGKFIENDIDVDNDGIYNTRDTQPLVAHPSSKELPEASWTAKTLPEHLRFACLLYTSPSPRDKRQSRMPSSA